MFYKKLKRLTGQKRLEFINICGIVEREYNDRISFLNIFYIIELSALAIIGIIFFTRLWIFLELITFLGMLIVLFKMKKDTKKTIKEKKAHLQKVFEIYGVD